ncbi:MAG: thiol peroxidase, partial [Flavobacteriales bacterium]|nr:thiol peroxidase [Flavobacteriales bacterium]
LGGNPIETSGNLPQIGELAKDFVLVKQDLSELSLGDLKGKKVILNIYPSVDTGTCAMSTRKFNAEASKLENTQVVCVSRDLPFAFKRFCGAEGIDQLITASDFKTGQFGKDYGLEMTSGALKGLHSRCIIVLDENSKVIYTEQVPEIANEPNYELAMAAIR